MRFFKGLCNCLKKRVMRDGGKEDKDDGGGLGYLFFDLRALQIATNFFSDLNMLGHGGFGPVYKVVILSCWVFLLE